ncbi:MAG: hypothetical protein ISN29_03330 [Gammaproteobacteria bacterium AqS3]|nr:hypothetical protein [Gammaproteobacteria bacterium AqS3]
MPVPRNFVDPKKLLVLLVLLITAIQLHAHTVRPCKKPVRITEGESGTFSLRTSARPEPGKNVTINLRHDVRRNHDVTFSPTQIIYRHEDWPGCKVVTVNAARDDDSKSEITFIWYEWTGEGFPARLPESVTVYISEPPALAMVLTGTPVNVPEGGPASFRVRLNRRPSGDVSVALAQSENNRNSDVMFAPSTLEFTDSNWNRDRFVWLRGAEDDDAFHDTATLVLTGSGADSAGMTSNVSVKVIENDRAELILSTPSLVIEEGGSGNFNVRLSMRPLSTVTVTLEQPGNADLKVDTDAQTNGDQNTLTFTTGNWETAQQVTVRAAEDDDAVSEPASLVSMTVTEGRLCDCTVSGSVAVSVRETDETGLIISKQRLALTEGGNGSFAVRLKSAPSDDVTVTLTVPDGADLRVDTDADTTGDQIRLSFTADDWNTDKMVTVYADKDDDAVSDPPADIAVSASGGDYAGLTGSVTVTVTENDTVGLVLSENSLSIEEGSSDRFDVRLETRPSSAVTISLTLPDGTDIRLDTDSATAGDQNALSFTTDNWNVDQTVTVRVEHDDDAIVDPAADITVSASGGDYAGETGSVEIVSSEDDTPGLSFSTSSPGILEGTSGSFTVWLATRPSATVTVSIAQPANSDVTVETTSLTFAPDIWNTPQSVSLSAVEDDNAMAETVPISLSAAGGDYAGVSGSVTLTVSDTDTPGLALSTRELEVEEGSSSPLTISLTTRPSATVTVSVAAAGNADVSVDETSLSFTTENWSTAQTVEVRAAEDDDTIEDIANIALRAAGGDYGSVSVSVSVTVRENDTARLILSPRSLGIREGGSGLFTVRLATRPSSTVTVTIAQPSNTHVTVGTTSLTFMTDDWNAEQNVTVSASQDDDSQLNRTDVALSASGGGYDSVTGSVTVSVADNDSPGMILSTQDLEIDEGSSGIFTVRLSTQPAATVNVSIAQPDNTDVTVENTTLSFSASDWRTAKNVRIRAGHDVDTSADTASVSLSAAGGGYDGVSGSVRISVKDDDKPGLVFSEERIRLIEGSSTSFDVRLATRPSSAVDVTIVQPANTDVTVGVTALTFTTENWRDPQSIRVITIRDDDALSDTASISLTATGGDYRQVIDSVGVSVSDIDTLGLLFSAKSLSVEEGDSARFQVRLGTRPSTNVTVTIVQPDNTDVTVDESTLNFTTENWNTVQFFTVRAAEDDDALRDTARITLNTAGGDYADLTDQVTVLVNENDSPGLVLSTKSLDIDEGESGRFTIELRTLPAAEVTVTLVQSANADITLDVDTAADGNQNVLYFDASTWNTPRTVVVYAAEDWGDLAARDKAPIRVTATSDDAGYGRLSDRVEVLVTDNDEASLSSAVQGLLGAIAAAELGSTRSVIEARLVSPPSGRSATLAGRSFDFGAGAARADDAAMSDALRHGWREGADRRPPGGWFGLNPGGAPGFGAAGLSNSLPASARRGSAEGSDAAFISAFSYTARTRARNRARPNGWAVWGRAEKRALSGESNTYGYDSTLDSIWLGWDYRLRPGGALFGITVSQSDAYMDYDIEGRDSRLKTELTKVMPYVQKAFDRWELQLTLGGGSGELIFPESDAAQNTVDLSLNLLLVSWRTELIPADGRAGLALTGSIGSNTLQTGRNPDLPSISKLKSDIQQHRIGLEWSGSDRGNRWKTAPSGRISLRQDIGDGLGGTGVEFTGKLRTNSPNRRLGLDADLHWLGVHSGEGVEEWSAGVRFQIMPRPGGRGLALRIGPEWSRGRVDALERIDPSQWGGIGAAPPQRSLSMNASYGLIAFEGLLSPYTEYRRSVSVDRHARLSGGVKFRRSGTETRLFGERRSTALGPARSGLGVEFERLLR